MSDALDIVERLRACADDPMWAHHAEIPKRWCDEAADEIEHLALDLQTERAAVVALQATVAGLRKSASLRVQFHAAELADVTAELEQARKAAP